MCFIGNFDIGNDAALKFLHTKKIYKNLLSTLSNKDIIYTAPYSPSNKWKKGVVYTSTSDINGIIAKALWKMKPYYLGFILVAYTTLNTVNFSESANVCT